MEFQFLSFSLLFLLSLFFFVLIMTIKPSASKNLPPGPWKLPFTGNLHNVLGTLPHHSLHALSKKFGPIMHLRLGQFNTIVISSPETAKQIMQTHDLIFATRPFNVAASIIFYNSSDIAFAPYGEFWRQMRKICMLEMLSAKRVLSFRPVREEEMLKSLKSICSGCQTDMSSVLFSYTLKVISRVAFGEIKQEYEAFEPIVKDITEVMAGFCVANLFPSIKFLHNIGGLRDRIVRLHVEADRILDMIIDDHKLKRKINNKINDHYQERDDLVDVLLNLQEQENLDFTLTIESIKGVILDMFVAGSETSATVVEWALSELMRNRKLLEKAQEEVRKVFGQKGYVDEEGLKELRYIKLIIKETLRLHPPIPLLLPREAQEQCQISGYNIPSKCKVIINASAICRDPNYWSDAESFIPERFSDGKMDYKGGHFEFIPFGAGRRMCPGLTFGTANTELPLASLLFHFDWKLPGIMKPEDLDMSECAGASVRRKNYLNLVPLLVNPLPIHVA